MDLTAMNTIAPSISRANRNIVSDLDRKKMTTIAPTIRILIADDLDIIRVGLSHVMGAYADIELVGTAKNGLETLHMCRQFQPDIVLLDLMMPDIDETTMIEELRSTCPNTRIVALTTTPDEALVRRVIGAGALSLLLKNVTVAALIEAIRAANEGRSTLAQEATQALIGAMQRPPLVERELSNRERDTLVLMMQGLKNPEIATQLMVSTSTVKKYVSSIFAKLNVSNRLEAVMFALQHDIVDG
jgi:DNA-binding NarL/FixJ family response regulator